jgi:hypothetical protein
MALLNPTPVRQFNRVFVTPRIEDFIRVETVDVSRIEIPEYGTPHPDTDKYRDFLFVYLASDDPQGLLFKFYYAKPRELQDDYNFEFVEADIGGTKFDAVKRTYVTLRSEFDPYSPTMGTDMPTDPDGLFGTGEYVLAERVQKRIGEQQLDSIFIQEERTYVQRCSMTDITNDNQLGIGVGKTTVLYYRGELVDGNAIETYFADPDNAFWGSQNDGTTVEGQQLSENWFAVITESSRDDALEAYKLSLPTITNLSLPDVLQGVEIVWNEAGGNGSFDSEWGGLSKWEGAIQASVSGAESASAEGSYSIQPELILDIRQPLGRNIPSTSYFFYMRVTDGMLDSAAFLTKVGTLINSGSPPTVNFWPSFNPVAHSIVLKGMKVSVSAKASASASMSAKENEPLRPEEEEGDRTIAVINKDANYGTGESYDVSTTTTVVRIPPTVHGSVPFTGTASKSGNVTATCNVGWPEGSFTDTLLGENVAIPEAEADASATLGYTASVSPTSLDPTSPTAIPSSGYYVVDSKISPYEAGWVSCFAEVINAANI